MSAHGNASLDAVTIQQTSTTGMAYANAATITPLLDNGSFAGGNAVMQTAALGFRQCTIGFSVDDAADIVVFDGDRDSKDVVTYVDPDGTVFSVVLFDFTRTMAGNGLWDCSAVLVEAPAGS